MPFAQGQRPDVIWWTGDLSTIIHAMDTVIDTTELGELAAKVRAGERLSFEDGAQLYRSNDIHTLGELATVVRKRLHGRAAYYNINRHINYTNFCVLRCKFCGFYRPYPKDAPATNPKEPQASACANDQSSRTLPILDESREPKPATPPDTYELSVDEIVSLASDAHAKGATEVHIVGGLHPTLPFNYYLDMCRAIKAACPDLHIKAFTAIEIIHFTRISKSRLSIGEVLEQLREAGLGSLPGGGAEIFDDRVHEEVYKNKVGERGWFDVHRTAHDMGIFSNATMLYGHVETHEDRVRHMIKLREHQDQSLASRKAHFNCVVPLSFIPDDSALSHLPGPTGLDDLKTLAISRLMCDNIPHIKAFWPMQSAKLAQVSLDWGVDDIDGTVVWYDITKRESLDAATHQELTVDKLKRLITESGYTPVERDTLYRPIDRD